MATERQIENARRLRRSSTDVEARLWSRLRSRQLEGAKFVRQHPIGPYVADFCCRSARLVIELDGGQHAEGARDAERTRIIEANGYTVLRFWNNDALGNPERVATAIAGALHEHHPHPTLPHQGGGIHGDNSKWHG